MRVALQHVVHPFRPLGPVELLVAVDGETVRVAIEWSTFERLTGGDLVNQEVVHDFIHKHRDDLELAIRAHLYAQGVPLARGLTLTYDELHALHQPLPVMNAASPRYAAGKA